jgi:acetoin utilization deacetylase AcuC-like enzyme
MADLRIPVVTDRRTDLHRDITGVWLGLPMPGDEEPDRTDAIREATTRRGAEFVDATIHDDEHLLAVHDPSYLHFLDTAHARWVAAGYPSDPGQFLVVPYLFPRPGFVPPGPMRAPAALHAEVGSYAVDTMTPIGPGTARAARGAFDCALTACDLVLTGERAAYAACRPPGHHVGRAFYGGSCYLNNAAGAAQYLRSRGLARVAIIDIDAHHGNGTQSIFYDRSDVWFGSVHVDPAAGWFPHYLGFADEVGTGPGVDANVNLPLPEGAADREWADSVATLCAMAARWRPDAAVVSLGVDAAVEDENSPLLVTEAGFRVAGAAIAGLGVPTVFVQEGGYVIDRLGAFVVAVLDGYEESR